MSTKTNKIQQNDKKTKLTDRQLKAIPSIVVSPTYSEGCKKAKLNRTTFYNWMKIPEFKAELDRQRDEVATEAFGILSHNLTKAVETLAELLNNKDVRIKRLIAKDIIEYFLKIKEIRELEDRITAMEHKLESCSP